MVSVNDASAASDIRDREWGRFERADIPEVDRDAIERFIKHRRVHGGNRGGNYTISTETTDLNKLRLASERAEKPLLEMDIDDLNEFIELLTAPKSDGGYGIGNGIDSYTRALRVFYQWLDQHGKEDDYPFWEQISTATVDRRDPRDRDFPDRDDYEAMMEAARGDPRAQAILAFYWESAVRRTLGAQLRLKHVDLDPDTRATFTPNPDGERQKDVEIKEYPLYEGVDKLRVWVNNHHPDPDNPEAPLFTVKKRFYDARRNPNRCNNCGYQGEVEAETCPECGSETVDDGALSANRIADILKDLGESAGVDAELKVHAFRHAAIGRWKERGYSLSQVQRRTAWKDSAAAEMWGRYGNPRDEAIDSKIDELEGEEPQEEGAEPTKPPEKYCCGNCGNSGITADHCGSCGAPVSPEARQQHMERESRRSNVEQQLGALRLLAQLGEIEMSVEEVDELADDPEAIEGLTEGLAAAEN